jgi:predicted metal-dependent hydrolase
MNITENIVYYMDMGEIKYVRSRRAKNLAIRIGRNGDVRVTVPGYVSIKKAEAFVFSKRSWIIQKVRQQKELGAAAMIIGEGDEIEVRGKKLTIRLKGEGDCVEEALWRMLHREAAAILPGRVRELAREHGLSYSGVKVRRMKSRWGSCNAKNGINLNTWLVMLPTHLCDYVILHELAHTRHRDHSSRFWDYLDGLTGGMSKQLRKELRTQQIMLIDTK